MTSASRLASVLASSLALAIGMHSDPRSTHDRSHGQLDDCTCNLVRWQTTGFTDGIKWTGTDLSDSIGLVVDGSIGVSYEGNACNAQCQPTGTGCAGSITFRISQFHGLPGHKLCVPLASPAFYPVCTDANNGAGGYQCCRTAADDYTTVGLEWYIDTGCGNGAGVHAQLTTEFDGSGNQALVADLYGGFDCTACTLPPN
ncbi:MAG: hypothetical protein IT457_25140 [Planctomycetes bacterium]|nr:hypothetical protein [Planctomycetota bacterium]